MPFQTYANNAKSTLSVAVTTNTQATLTLQSGHGARFPTILAPNFFDVTLDDGTNVEICKCIDNTSDVLTVVRGQQGTTPQSSFATGTKVELRLTAGALEVLGDKINFQNFYMRPVANVTSWHILGTVLPTLVNSNVAGTLTNSSWREQNARIRITCANSAQNPIELRIPQPTAAVANGFHFYTRFGFAQVPNSCHFFVGLVNTTGQVTSVHPPSSITNGVVIGWANAALGTNLSIWRNDGSGNAVQLDLGSYFTANTLAWYEMQLVAQANNARIDYTVKRLDISSIADATSFFTTDIPANSLWLSPIAHGASMVTSALAVELGGWAWES